MRNFDSVFGDFFAFCLISKLPLTFVHRLNYSTSKLSLASGYFHSSNDQTPAIKDEQKENVVPKAGDNREGLSRKLSAIIYEDRIIFNRSKLYIMDSKSPFTQATGKSAFCDKLAARDSTKKIGYAEKLCAFYVERPKLAFGK